MCGIVGYIGRNQAQDVLFSCLSNLEYRGYDSSGIAVRGSGIEVYKDCVRVNELRKQSGKINGTMGIGHTRWATHGCPSERNAHPHLDCTSRFAVVHNGVINNYQALIERLIAEGHRIISETDTEVIPHLIEKYYRGNLEEAVTLALAEIDGSYAIAVICEDERKIVAARKDSPLIIGIGTDENYIASDIPALLDYTNKAIVLENGDLAVITDSDVQIRVNGTTVERRPEVFQWTKRDIEKQDFAHYMLKEIHEQPHVVRNTLTTNDFSEIKPLLVNLDSLLIVASGTSYHAGLVGEYILAELLGIPVTVRLASEFNYSGCRIIPPMAILITQSGETADVLLAMKILRQAGSRTIAITNVHNSSASRLADIVFYTNAGPEISVAATKSFLAQMIVLYQLALFCQVRSGSSISESLGKEIQQIPDKIQAILDRQHGIVDCAIRIADAHSVFFIGRGINLPVVMEGALKLKEISYIHAEAYAAGELKHGPLALIDKRTPVIAVIAQDITHTAMLTSIKEVKARGAPIIALASETSSNELCECADYTISVPSTHRLLSPVLNAVVLQLLAYHTACRRNCPIDFPRNLAKSVTVE